MNNLIPRYIEKRKVVSIFTVLLLLSTLLASLAAGPDDPRASTVNNDWEIFEGHAYADNRAAPSGVSLIACLGGCEDGYQTEAVVTGKDGLYQVRVEPGQTRPIGRMVTFWLLDDSGRVEADQDVLFRGQGETRVLDLNFLDLPSAVVNGSSPQTSASSATGSTDDAASTSASDSAASNGATSGSGSASPTGGVTTDLTVPDANELGLVPSDSPQSYLNSVSYGGMPLLPGFVIVLGLLIAMLGVSLLIYRRRLAWR